jgi:hypothetical protein
MRAASRSRARRSGTCGVMPPRRRNQSLRYRGFIPTANVRATSNATRGAVHRSVAKPNSVGLRSIHPSTRPAWAAVSLGGRPGRGRLASAASPPDFQAATQRCTDRTLTPSTDAISVGESPCSHKPIAHNRACSNCAAVLGVLMEDIIINREKIRHD